MTKTKTEFILKWGNSETELSRTFENEADMLEKAVKLEANSNVTFVDTDSREIPDYSSSKKRTLGNSFSHNQVVNFKMGCKANAFNSIDKKVRINENRNTTMSGIIRECETDFFISSTYMCCSYNVIVESPSGFRKSYSLKSVPVN